MFTCQDFTRILLYFSRMNITYLKALFMLELDSVIRQNVAEPNKLAVTVIQSDTCALYMS